MTLGERAIAALERHPAVRGARLVGSRAEGRDHAASDWDVAVEADDFEAVAAALPGLLAPLEPIAHLWDRLSPHATFMLVLPGPVKVDVVFLDVAHELEPPWRPDAGNLEALDTHFWDWTLWLAGKQAAGRDEFVAAELRKQFEHLLGPLGVQAPPRTLGEAVAAYRAARARAEERFGVRVGRRLEAEVAPTISG